MTTDGKRQSLIVAASAYGAAALMMLLSALIYGVK
jgi:hypothetical protein